MKDPRRLGKVLAAAGFAADVTWLVFHFDNAATADATINLASLPKCRIREARYLQTANATAVTSFTAKLYNLTKTVDVTSALDIKTLGANSAAAMVLSTTDANLDVAAGNILQIVFDETGGTVTAPGVCSVFLAVQMLD